MSLLSSPGEIGGAFAGLVALLVAVGHGVKWLFNWHDARNNTRHARLDAWEAKLAKREAEFEAAITTRLETLERENRAYRLALSHSIPALRALDPENPGLRAAEDALRSAFSVHPLTPPDIDGLADKIG